VDRCTFCGSDATDRAFIAKAPSSDAAICETCLALAFRKLEYKKGLVASPGVGRIIGAASMWPLERRLRQFNHAYWRGRAAVRERLRSVRRGSAPGSRAAAAPSAPAPLSAMFVQRVHPLAQFERRCAMCSRRDELMPTPKGARICEPCVESWTRTLLG